MKKNPFIFTVFLISCLFVLITLTKRKTDLPQSVTRSSTPKFIPFDLDTITKIGFILPAGEIKLNKSNGANWQINFPITDQADSEYINNLIDKISKMRVRATYSEADLGEPEFELNPPPVKIIIENSGMKNVVFELGTENRIDNSLLFRTSDSPLIFKVASPNLELTTKTLNNFRSPLLTTRKVDKLSFFSLYKKGDLQFSFTRINDQWHSSEDELKSFEQSDDLNFDKLFQDALDLKILEYVLDDKSIENALQEYGLENPIFEIRFSSQREKTPTSIVFSDILGPQVGASDNRIAATSNEKSGVYFIHADTIRNIESLGKKLRKITKLQ